jgi:hypothetical protein
VIPRNRQSLYERGAQASCHRGACDGAVTIDDDTAELRFDPTAPVPDLVDPIPEGISRAELKRIIDPFLLEGMASYAQSGGGSDDRVLGLYRQRRACYGLGIVFAEGAPDRYRFD